MDSKIVQWVQCDDKIKEYNNKTKTRIQPIKDMKDKLGQEIMTELDVHNKEKSDLPTFNIPTLKTSITPQVSNTYEGYTNKFYKECFTEYLGSEEKADELIKFMKDRRKVEKKFTLKREMLMDLTD